MLLPLKWQAWSDNLTTPKKKKKKAHIAITPCHNAWEIRNDTLIEAG
jgi:hypothetical protein